MLRVGLAGWQDARWHAVAEHLTQLGVTIVAVGPRAHLVVGVGVPDNGVADVWVDGVDAVDQLWADRLLPFTTNLRTGRRAPRPRLPVLSAPNPSWPRQAQRLIDRVSAAAGDLLLRIDHIGSTSVAGLPAKDLLDIQLVVADLDAARQVAERASQAGLVHVAGEWFGTDRSGVDHREEVMVDADPGRPVNVNIRPVTDPVWQDTLLFRDWLRSHPGERDAYAAMKRELAAGGPGVDAYSRNKLGWIASALARADGHEA